MKKTPNIFDYATSELSQDAFLTWLIQWADKDYQKTDKSLNNCAISFVQELLGKDESYKIETVEAGRQWNNIDVWALVNNKYFIVVEDKKGTKEHSDQLNRYSEIAKKHYENSNIEIKLIYFKMVEQGQYNEIENAGFSIFKRSKMLLILEKYVKSTEKIEYNNILVDYYKNLDNLNKQINSYLTEPINEWYWYSWQGFYAELQKHIGGDWNYVSNRAGGFMGFWWNHKFSNTNGKEFHYYLQLEQDKFVFKLIVDKKDERKVVRDYYRSFLYKKANELNIGITQFGRIGKHMGVAKLNSEYRITNKSGLLDIHATVENLKTMMNLINETEKEIKST
jgi:hypothetical protein